MRMALSRKLTIGWIFHAKSQRGRKGANTTGADMQQSLCVGVSVTVCFTQRRKVTNQIP